MVGVTIEGHFAKNVLTVEKLTGQTRGTYEYKITTTLRRSRMVFTYSFLFDDMDVDVYMEIIAWYDVSRKDEMKVYMIQGVAWILATIGI